MTSPGPLDHRPPDAVPPAVPAWAKVAAAVVVGGIVVASFLQARKPTAQGADFGAYYRAGQAVAAGRSPYTLDPKYRELGAYMYCPAFADVVCRPLAGLSYVGAMRVFLAVNWLATAAVVALSLRLAIATARSPGCTSGAPPRPSTFLVGLVTCAAAGTYLWADLHNGQVGTLLLLACLGWITLTLSGRPALGGAALSLAVGLKLYPLLLAPYLLLRRQWWPGLVGLAIGLGVQFVVPAMFGGRSGLGPLHAEWLRFCLHTQVPMQTVRAGNQSLLGVLARMPGISDGVHLFSQDRLDALQHAYPAVVAAVTALLYGWLWSRRTRHPAADVAVLLVWMTVASPRAWTFNFAAEVPAAALLAAAAVAGRPRWPLAVAGLVGLVYAVTFPTNLLRPPTRWAAGPQFLYDKHVAAAVLLAVAVAVVARPEAGTRAT